MRQEAYFCTVKELDELGKNNIPQQLISHTHLIYSSPATLAFNSPGAEGFGVKRAGLAVPDSIMLIVSPGCCGRNTSVLSSMQAYHDRFYYLLMDETEIDAILLGKDSGQSDVVSQIVRQQAQEFVSDLLSSLRERMLELKSGKVIFTGGGAVLLRQQIEASDKVREPVFIEDIAANVKGYQLLYQAERIGRNHGR